MAKYLKQFEFTVEELDYLDRRTYENDVDFFWSVFREAVGQDTFVGLLTRGESKRLRSLGILAGDRSARGRGKRLWFSKEFAGKHGSELGL